MTDEKSAERIEIEDRLRKYPWIKESTAEVLEKLFGLPESANGFLKDLSKRPIEGGGVRILNLEKISFSPFPNIFGIIPFFRVQVLNNPEIEYGYEYISWKQGPESGSKGLILLENEEGEITHVVLLKGFKFAVGEEVYDAVGGFASPDEEGIAGMIRRFETEIKEELGIPDIKITRTIPLGRLQVDAGLTNNYPNLFAAVVDGSQIDLKEDVEIENPDPYEMRASVVVIPVEELDRFVLENDDAYFLGCVARLRVMGII